MYCPKCKAENRDDIKYCRVCGANLALIQQALSGQLPLASTGKHGKHKDKNDAPTMENAIQNGFGGLGFIFVSIAILFYAPAGRIWWFWMLIPAFGYLGKAASQYFSVKQQQQNVQQTNQLPQYQQPAIAPPPTPVNFGPRNTGEIVEPPPSVTESTTKLFDPPGK
jgi:hypothetical protein